MARILVPLAHGCEELEAVTIIDLLRRAGLEVVSAGLEPGPVKASRGVVLQPDVLLDAVLDQPSTWWRCRVGCPVPITWIGIRGFTPCCSEWRRIRLYCRHLCGAQGSGMRGC